MGITNWFHDVNLSNRLFTPDERGHYPHMLPRDVDVWNRFLDQQGFEFVGFRYDVHVGGEVERKVGWTEKTIMVASYLAAKRIDAVGYKAGETWIFEVKPEAGVSAVGQLVTYRLLYIDKFRPIGRLVCALVCANATIDERHVLEDQGFKIFVV